MGKGAAMLRPVAAPLGIRSDPCRQAGLRLPSGPGQLWLIDRFPGGARVTGVASTRSCKPGGWGGISRDREKVPKGETRGEARHPR